jgi:hypothetical protein
MRRADLEVKTGGMKPTMSLTVTRTQTSPEKRRQILVAFERSGLSAAALPGSTASATPPCAPGEVRNLRRKV